MLHSMFTIAFLFDNDKLVFFFSLSVTKENNLQVCQVKPVIWPVLFSTV